MTKKRRSSRGRAVEHGPVVLYEWPGGTAREKIAWARGLIRALGYPCILCSAPEPDTIGSFMPDPDALLEQGGTLTIWYGLCEDCSCLSDTGERVEARVLAS